MDVIYSVFNKPIRFLGILLFVVLFSVPQTIKAQERSDIPYTLNTLGEFGFGSYGGLTFDPNDPNIAYIAVNANSASAQVYKLQVDRDVLTKEITGFTRIELRATTPSIDGSFTIMPNGTLIYVTFDCSGNNLYNYIGQVPLGSTVAEIEPIHGLSGWNSDGYNGASNGSSTGGLVRNPPFHPSKPNGITLYSWTAGDIFDLDFTLNGDGTYTFNDVNLIGSRDWNSNKTGSKDLEGLEYYRGSSHPKWDDDRVVAVFGSFYSSSNQNIYYAYVNDDGTFENNFGYFTSLNSSPSGLESFKRDPVTNSLIGTTWYACRGDNGEILFRIGGFSACTPGNSNQLPDLDGDGVPDLCDLDDDNDGILDSIEEGVGCIDPNDKRGIELSGDIHWATEADFIGQRGIYTLIDGVLSESTYPCDLANGFCSNGPALTDRTYLKISFPQARTLTGLEIVYGDGDAFRTDTGSLVHVQASNDGVNWINAHNGVYTGTNDYTTGAISELPKTLKFHIDSAVITQPYKHFRIQGVSGYTSTGYVKEVFFAYSDIPLPNTNCIEIAGSRVNDTDGDGIPNTRDTDSDGDGCFDAIEGAAGLAVSNVDANGRFTGAVDSNGIPLLAGNGQGIGTSQDLNVKASNCCPVLAVPTSGGDKSYCTGEPVPAITATVDAGNVVDWYAAETGGTALATNTLSYTPSEAGTYYAQTRNMAGCLSTARTAVTISFTACLICQVPTLTAGTLKCEIASNSYKISYNSDVQDIAAFDSTTGIEVGTVNTATRTITGIPLGVDVDITATIREDCKASIGVTGLTNDICSASCAIPDLSIGNGICRTGGGFQVLITETTGAIITTVPALNSGTIQITNNILTVTDVSITSIQVIATSITGGCETRLSVTAPTDCTNECLNSPISIGGFVCTSTGGYNINYTAITGATVSVTDTSGNTISGVTVGANFIRGIPNGMDVNITTKVAGCTDRVLTFLGETCISSTIAIDDINNVFEGQSVDGNVLTNDIVSGNTKVVRIPTGGIVSTNGVAVIMNTNGNYTYKAPSGSVGSDTFTYEVCDGANPANCDIATVYIKILAKTLGTDNSNPVANADTAVTYSGVPVSGVVLANDFDPDGDTIMVTTTSVTTNNGVTVSINSITGAYTYTPKAEFMGEDSFQYTICDNKTPQKCDTTTVTIHVIPDDGTNRTTANDDAYFRIGNGDISENLLANDSDPEGHAQTIEVVPVIQPSNGKVVINANGTFVYTVNSSYVGSDRFVYRVCDNGTPQACATATVYLTIQQGTTIAIDDINVIYVDEMATGNVLTNDRVQGSTKVVTTNSVTTVKGITVAINANGTYSYRPAAGFIGTDTFTYTVCDGETPANCDEAIVHIQVIPKPNENIANRPPVANTDTAKTLDGVAVNGNVLSNDFDPDGDIIMVTTTTVKSKFGVTITLRPNGSYTYTPENGFIGEDTFEYTVCDSATPSLCTKEMVIITVLARKANTNVTFANDDVYITFLGDTIAKNLLENDSDPEGNTQRVNTTPVVAPNNGTLALSANGDFEYTPNNGFTGTDQFVYRICDDGTPQACDTATVYIIVDPTLCLIPTLSVGKSSCDGSTYEVLFTSNGTVTTSAGTINTTNDKVVDIPIGTDAIISSRGKGTCTTSILVKAPNTCPTECTTPDLVVGNPICDGTSYKIRLTETTGAIITVSEGILENGELTVILGKEVTITAMNWACTVKITIKSPQDCDVACIDPPISLGGVICSPTATGNYTVTYSALSGATITVDKGIVDTGTNTITVPITEGDVTITAKVNGCKDVVTTVKACSDIPTTCPTHDLVINDAICDSLYGNTYSVTYMSTPGASVAIISGTLRPDGSVTADLGVDIIIEATKDGCTLVRRLLSPQDCKDPCSVRPLSNMVVNCTATNLYELRFTTIPGATIIASAGTVGDNIITDIPSGTDISVTVVFAGCEERTVVIPTFLWGALDCDGDGVTNERERSDGTDFTDPCGFNSASQDITKLSSTWNMLDCDNDKVSNGQEIIDGTDPLNACDSIGGAPPESAECTVEIENKIITPNGDGINDVIIIKGLASFPNNTVEIYNRWGVIVYSVKGYNNQSTAFRAESNGRVTLSKPKQLPTGTYFIIISYEDDGTQLVIQDYIYINL